MWEGRPRPDQCAKGSLSGLRAGHLQQNCYSERRRETCSGMEWQADFSAWFAPDRRNGLNQRQQLRHIMGVGPGDYARERDTLRVGEKVVLAPRLTAIGWVRSSFFPRCMARTDELSTIARARSSWSRRRNSASSMSRKRCRTPVSCHSLSRRQQVTPEPQPISWGNISQGIPLFSTNKIPPYVSRCPTGLQPAVCRLRFPCGGNNGSISFHSASSTRGFPKHRLRQVCR